MHRAADTQDHAQHRGARVRGRRLYDAQRRKGKAHRADGKGRGYIDGLLGGVLEAERAAMEETVADFGADFIPAIERFESALGEELRRRVLGGDS